MHDTTRSCMIIFGDVGQCYVYTCAPIYIYIYMYIYGHIYMATPTSAPPNKRFLKPAYLYMGPKILKKGRN